uniref:Similar to sodium channel putative n=1 Tax=Albugo laibachii Nc14 TaxID=890382 RepID=F0WCG7_9STRA|nr:similar to sodium channel putative [Albugo laibachii Nc14]|eukprot:CCA18882.1 similar to sodium channel putative [Albugo laibachii Nc14]
MSDITKCALAVSTNIHHSGLNRVSIDPESESAENPSNYLPTVKPITKMDPNLIQANVPPQKLTPSLKHLRTLFFAQSHKSQSFAGTSLFFFSKQNFVRRWCINIATSRILDIVVVSAIIANSAILGITDHSVVDHHMNPSVIGYKYDNGAMVEAYSQSNWIVQSSELPFTALFTVECALKIIAMGFIRSKGAYLRDAWNVLDFVVVLMSLIGILPSIPNVSAIRTIRVLRPLRSLSMIPGMRRLISALLKALPALANVVILQLFVFLIFGILGIQLFGGLMTSRCRLTPYPIKMPVDKDGTYQWPIPSEYLAKVISDPVTYQCLNEPLLSHEDRSSRLYTKETSPWRFPQDCFWPINSTDETLCTFTSESGVHKCSQVNVCGSDYDAFGNPRFKNEKVMQKAVFSIAFDYGYTTFDNIGKAFFTIFQAITQEGWTVIMYMTMDTSQPIVASLFFVILMIFASFFLMNLTLAVISDEFNLDDQKRQLVSTSSKSRRSSRLDSSPSLLMLSSQSTSRIDPSTSSQRTQSKMSTRNSFYYRVRKCVHVLVSHQAFSGVIMLVIMANTTVMALDHYPMPPTLSSNLEVINFGLSCVFVVEMLLKVFGLGFCVYARDRFNLFDAFIVVMSMLELILSPPSFLSKNRPSRGNVSALRTFRLFRVFKLARNWKSFRELLALIIRAVAGIANFAVLLFLFIYIYALLGIQFYANTMRFDADAYAVSAAHGTDLAFWNAQLPRSNFDSLLWAFVTVFQVITGENWNNVMYDAIRANGFTASIYFISLVILGNFILMNLFLALLLDNFAGKGGNDTEERQQDLQNLAKRLGPSKVVPDHTHRNANESHAHRQSLVPIADMAMPIDPTKLESREKRPVVEMKSRVDHLDVKKLNTLVQSFSRIKPLSSSDVDDPRDLFDQIVEFEKKFRDGIATPKSISQEKNQEEPSMDAFEERWNWLLSSSDLPPNNTSLYFFPEKHPWRRIAFAIINHPVFDNIVLLLIAVSSIALAVDNPLSDPTSSSAKSLKTLEKFCTILFTIEMLFKVFALGLFMHKDAYLRNKWNVLDGIIVVTSWVTLIAESSSQVANLKFLRPLRGLRAFRPLRMISRRPGLKLVVNALFESVPAVMNVMFVCVLFYLIFSIIAVNNLKGTFYKCTGKVFDRLNEAQLEFLTIPSPWISLKNEQKSWFDNTTCQNFTTFQPYADASDLTRITSRYICECWGASWEPPIPWNFNNIGWAMLTFFELSTTEGWVTVMTQAIDATDIDMQPIRDHQMKWAYFFVIFNLVGSFFVVNLFVGVIIDNFNRMKAALGGDFMLTPEQKKWIEAQKAALRIGPVRLVKVPKNKYRKWIHTVVRASWFEWFSMICIIINTLLMAAQYFGEASMQLRAVNLINELFAGVFTAEALMKGIAYGSKYFEDAWNRFDFFVVGGTLLSVIVEAITGTSVRSMAMLIRVFRVTRIMRLIKASKSIQQILTTLYVALPGLSNVASILFLMLFIYATMGVQLFAKVAHGDNIDNHSNFQGFWTAILLLLRSATGEAWDALMHDYASKTPGCVSDPPFNASMCGFHNFDGCIPLNGCGNPMAYIYFCTFTLLVTYVMLNLTIAIILEGFSSSHIDEEPIFEPDLLLEFTTKWSWIDPKAVGYIRVQALCVLANILGPPLGIANKKMDRNQFVRYTNSLYLPLYEDEMIHFRDVLLAMTRELVKENLSNNAQGISEVGVRHADETTRRRLDFHAHDYFAISRIQHAVLRWLRTKRELEALYMEEYKNKIKKPSGRPKKSRDARVYTIG